MCGFAGYFTTHSLTADSHRQAVEAMIDPIKHRGPDDAGTWVDADVGIAFGFRRLAIIDLSEHGHQPMKSRTGRFTMVFNGEVYNFETLRKELVALGASFRGHSDSEVMLAAFEAWGVEAAVRRFDGMFAVAAWDAKDRCLHLFRDRFGEKPLFVYAEQGYVAFGSELKALRKGLRFDTAVDQDAVTSYLRYLCVPAPLTIFKHCKKVLPGTLLTIRSPKDALPAPSVYWSAVEVATRGQASPFAGDDEDALVEAERIIGEAASLRMVADVPLGAFLSGGIDSSTVVALMQERASKPVRTFSIGFEEAEYDESAHAARIARHLGTDHAQFKLNARDALSLVPELPEWFDEPHADPSQLPTYLLCREARREVTVAVSGDGGDELFGGYNRYVQGEKTLRLASRLGSVGRSAVAGGIGLLSPMRWNRVAGALGGLGLPGVSYRDVGEKLYKIAEVMRQSDAPAGYRALLASAFRSPEGMTRGGRMVRDAIDTAFAVRGELGVLERMMLADQLEYLPDDLLAKVDRTSMAVSLEVRVPLLARDVAEFAWRLPRRFKVRNGETKWLLRQLLYRRVPREMVDRPKMGFSVPIDRWIRGELRGWVQDNLSESSLATTGLLQSDAVREVYQRFERNDGTVSGLGIWALVNLQAWGRRWL